jgi:RecA/RadA recombinase
MSTFTAEVMLAELLANFSSQDLIKKIGISKPTLKKLYDGEASNEVLFKLEQAFLAHVRANIKQISMSNLKSILESGNTVMVDTPDGPQAIIKFFNKDARSIVKLSTANGKTLTCSNDHLVETDFGWAYANKDVVGKNVLTGEGFNPVIKVEDLAPEPVFDFEVAHPNHRYWGGDGISSHNSGKSFIASNLALQAQKDGYHVLYLDSEHAIDVDYLKKIGVDVSEDSLTYLSVTTIEDVNSVLSEFFSGYVKAYGKDSTTAPKTLIVLDSLAMLSSATEMENYDKGGIIKADQGILAKRRKAMLRLATGHLGRLPVNMVITDHVYPADIMAGDGAWAITNSTKFSSSIIGIVTKLKLKEEGEITGVRMRFETYKSRFAKLGTKVELEVPYNKGMSPFSGLLPLLESMGVIAKGTKPGEKLLWVCEWTDEDGEIHEVKFKEKDLTDDIVQELLKHPLCAATMARPATKEDEPSLEDDDVE